MIAVLVFLGLAALLAIVAALVEPSIGRWQCRRDERARLRAVMAVIHMFNGGGRR